MKTVAGLHSSNLTVAVSGSLWPKGVELLFGVLVGYSGYPIRVTAPLPVILIFTAISLFIRASNSAKTLTYITFLTVFPYRSVF